MTLEDLGGALLERDVEGRDLALEDAARVVDEVHEVRDTAATIPTTITRMSGKRPKKLPRTSAVRESMAGRIVREIVDRSADM